MMYQAQTVHRICQIGTRADVAHPELGRMQLVFQEAGGAYGPGRGLAPAADARASASAGGVGWRFSGGVETAMRMG